MLINHIQIQLLTLALLGTLSCAAHADNRAVAVEAIGYATLAPGETLQDVHREALNDAAMNAIVQAKVSVDVSVKVEDMQLKEKGIRTRGLGFIENMEVHEAGLMPYTEPPVYRVRVRAMVRRLPSFPATHLPVAEGEDLWRPRLALGLDSDLSEDMIKAYRSSVAASLRSCGIAVTAPDERGAIATRILIEKGEEQGEGWLTVSWEMSLGDEKDPHNKWANPALRGNWLLSGGASPSSEWWQRLGVMMAQDAVRLWMAPRPVTITIENTKPDEREKLQQVIGARYPLTVPDPAHANRYRLVYPLAGNPAQSILPLLEKADLVDLWDPVETGMSQMTFTSRP